MKRGLPTEKLIGRLTLILSLFLVLFALFFKVIYSKIYLLPIAVGFLLFSVYSFYISPLIPPKKKIEIGVIFFSMLLVFIAFLSNVFVQGINLQNDYLFIEMECPESISENEKFEVAIINSNLQQGTRFKLKFIGNGICINEGEECKEKKQLNEDRFALIFAGQNKTYTMSLNKITNPAQFYLKFHDFNGNLIYSIPKKCKY